LSRKLKPVGDRLAVRAVEQAEKTAGGIFLPDTAKEKSQEGIVVAVGPGRTLDNGTLVPVSVQPGQHILYSKYAGSEMKVDGEDLLIISEKDVLAAFEPAMAGAAK
jgi:chaperonin GroES